ncbi:hypothetical protein [Asaia sp. HumB]|uniref:hypothetical protein n=1 Tax=Asaia sp. HumB TaxID=3035475 RepID=UPI00255748D3|nr:hypothetical protein [Asaia sp. HumB]MDL2169568.1 hypothetical protein [Asaia sp. HumB]MDL2169801.1 hypothetical protein [Asaia sp. HumB]
METQAVRNVAFNDANVLARPRAEPGGEGHGVIHRECSTTHASRRLVRLERPRGRLNPRQFGKIGILRKPCE